MPYVWYQNGSFPEYMTSKEDNQIKSVLYAVVTCLHSIHMNSVQTEKKHMCETERCQGHELDEDFNFFCTLGTRVLVPWEILGDHDDSNCPILQ